jgi:hypothetical protein
MVPIWPLHPRTRVRRPPGLLMLGAVCYLAISVVPGGLSAQGFCHSARCQKTPPSCANNEAWNTYKRDLAAATSMFQDVDSENMRGLAEFGDAARDIDKEMGLDYALGSIPTTLEVVSQQRAFAAMSSTIAEAEHQAAIQIGQGEFDLAENTYAQLASEISEANFVEGVAVLPGIVVDLEHVQIAWTEYDLAVANLDRSEQLQQRMFRDADAKWKRALGDYQKAVTQDAKCAADRKKLQDEASLERRAAHYIENLEGGYHRPDGSWQQQWVIHNRAYNDFQSAIDAAKQILSPPPSSGSLIRPARTFYASIDIGGARQPSDTTRLTRAQAVQLKTLLQRVANQVRIGAAANTALIDVYVTNWRTTHSWIARISKPR